jgi:hypothetical protein
MEKITALDLINLTLEFVNFVNTLQRLLLPYLAGLLQVTKIGG